MSPSTPPQPANPPLPSSSEPPTSLAAPLETTSPTTSTSVPGPARSPSTSTAPLSASPPLSATAPAFRTASPPLSPTAPIFRASTPPLSPAAPSFCASSSPLSSSTSPDVDSGPGEPLGVVPRPSKKANITELRATLTKLGMDTRGKKETLYKRLFAAHIKQKEDLEAAEHAASAGARAAALAASSLPEDSRQPHVSYLCFDVEATCMSGRGTFDYPNEIIEFPVVLLQWVYDVETDDEGDAPEPGVPRRRRRVNPRLEHVDTFHTYVRPTWRPQLSTFCTSLTGIQQSTVDAAPTFPKVLEMLEDWLRSWGLLEKDELQSAMWVTDGPWDLKDFVAKQLHITPTNPPRYPKYFLSPYLNIKAGVRTVLSEQRRREQLGNPPGLPRITTGRHARWQVAVPPMTITQQLTELGVGAFAGRQHSGIDDATNISRILRAIADRNVLLEPNATLPPASNTKRWAWMGKPGEVLWNTPADPIGGVETDLIRLALDDISSDNGKAARALTAICATT